MNEKSASLLFTLSMELAESREFVTTNDRFALATEKGRSLIDEHLEICEFCRNARADYLANIDKIDVSPQEISQDDREESSYAAALLVAQINQFIHSEPILSMLAVAHLTGNYDLVPIPAFEPATPCVNRNNHV